MSRRSKGVGSRGLSDPLGRRGSSGGSKRSRVSKPKKYQLKIDEKDLEKLCEPFANQKLTFKCYLYTRDGSLYNRDDRPKLTVSLYYADNTFAQSKNSTSSKRAFSSLENVIAGKACGTDFLTVSGNEINEEGEAKVSVSVLKLSKDVKNRSFRLRFRMDGEEFKGIPHVLSEPFKTYNHKLKVLNKIEETFYKDEGGLQKSMLLSLELHSVSGLETKLEVPLILTLHYDDAKKTQLNSDSQKFLRVMDDQSELKIVKGKAAIRFRINDVSKNHQKLLFCVRVAPENIPKYRDVAFAFTSGVKVLSKRNKTKRKPANVLSGIGNNMGTGVEGTIAESSAESNLDNKALYRIQIPANVKKKIQSEEKVPLANLVMIVSQYAAKTSMWMDDVVKRHKRFKSEWDKYVAPCIAQLVQHVKDNVQEEGGSAGTGRVSASTSSSTNRPRKKTENEQSDRN